MSASTHMHSHKLAVYAVIHDTMTIRQAARHHSRLGYLGVDNRHATNTIADHKTYWRDTQNKPGRWPI